MRALRTKQNVIPPDSDYTFGRIKDDDGSKNGTPVNESVCGDSFQFFEKLMFDAQLAMNNLPENAYSGFQLNQALGILFKMFAVNIGLGGADLGDGRNGGTINIPSGHDLQTLPSQNLAPFANKFNGQRYFGGFFSVANGATNVPIAGQTGTLIDVYSNSTEELQIFFSDTGLAYYNIKTASAWLGWVQIGGLASWIDVSSFGTNIASVSGQAKAQYRKENSRVWVRGTVAKSVAVIPAASTTTLFTLPAGYRPHDDLRVPIVATSVNADNIFLWIKTDGTVNIVTGTNTIGIGTVIYLGEFTFSTDGSTAP